MYNFISNILAGLRHAEFIQHPSPELEPIYTFRTITTMLSHIQSGMEVTNSKLLQSAPTEQVYELKILDALAAVIVRRQEAVAVMANNDNTADIQVLISVSHLTSAEGKLTRLLPDNFFGTICKLLLGHSLHLPAKNPNSSYHPLKYSHAAPAMADPTLGIPSYLKASDGRRLLETFLEKEWREEIFKFDTHVWMLKKLLEQAAATADNRHTLQLYVIAACFPKMLCRMSNRFISAQYLASLKSVSSFELPEQVDKVSPKNNELNSDRAFIREILPKITNGITTEVPNLMQQAKDTSGVSGIYTKDTCMEFHLLLCELLTLFLESLKELEDCWNSSADRKAAIWCLEAVLGRGVALRAMVRGAAIEKHLKVIAHLLHCDESGKHGEEKGQDRGDGDDEGDAELQGVRSFVVQQGQPLPLWNAYRDWLRLMVIHFDAVQVLIGHVSKLQNPTISFKILSSPMPDQKMLPWKDLLRNESYFPEILLEDGSQPPSVKELIDFLDPSPNVVTASTKGSAPTRKGASIEQVIKLMKAIAAKASGTVEEKISDIDSAFCQRSLLGACTSPEYSLYAQGIIERTKSLKDSRQLPELNASILEIVDMLSTLKSNLALHRALKKGTPLSSGTNFTGTRHCELCLAALVSISGQPRQNDGIVDNALLDEIAQYGPVIGVSKRCCPACARVLTMLRSKDKKQFIFKGSHSTITACTLPEWLPADVIASIVSEYGGKLRRELVKLQQRTEMVRPRTHSTDLRRLSLDSVEHAEMSIVDESTIWNLAFAS